MLCDVASSLVVRNSRAVIMSILIYTYVIHHVNLCDTVHAGLDTCSIAVTAAS